MDLTNGNTLKTLLKKHGIKPKKYLGQNFLVSRIVLQQFIDAADISKDDTVIEVGPGIGTITAELAKRARKVTAVEKDPRLAEILMSASINQNVRGRTSNILVINEDLRKFDPKHYKLKTGGYTLVGNLPFYLTNFLIRKFLESDTPPKNMVLIIQKEVAKRICANPPRMNLLAVAVQYYGKPEIKAYVSKKSFWPEPEVDAAILRITLGGTVPPRGDCPPPVFFKIVRAGFHHPRKLLASNLSKTLGVSKEKVGTALIQNHINPRARAENLSVKDWTHLSRSLNVL